MNLINRYFGILTLLVLSFSLMSQGLPSTAISLITLDPSKTKSLSNPKFLTGFNTNGYNNQPFFFDANNLFITSDWNAKGQTDILKLNLKNNSILKITETNTSEYSPTLMYGNSHLSCIAVPPDQKSNNPTQLLWKYPINRSNSGSAINYDIENVGYHHWVNSIKVALFLVDDPHQLVILDSETGEMADIDKNVGRCFRMMDKENLLYVHKAAHNIWYLKSYNVKTSKKSIIGETKTGSEDFELFPNGDILMGQGSKLHVLSHEGGWKEIIDLGKYKVKNITRLALFNNKIAIVHAS